MKLTISSLLLAGGLLTATVASATTATYQACSVSGCRTLGSSTVTSTYAQTKYPVVLAHGMSGFSNIYGFDYWYGISPDLTSNGARVFETQVASFNSSYVRGEQLLNQVQQIIAITGSDKVNLIGHSQGAIDVRYVGGVIPSQIASVTGVAGPQTGSPVADSIQTIVTSPVGPVLAPILSGAVNAFFTLVDGGSGQTYSQSSLAGLQQLTAAGMASYNAQFPAGMPSTPCGQGAAVAGGIRYYSWGGTSKLTTGIDPSDALLVATGLLIPGKSDGLVPQCASHLGQVIRDDYPQNHLDEVNQVGGLIQAFTTSPVTLFRQHLNRIKLAGL
jgi:triacylglycerol lipase